MDIDYNALAKEVCEKAKIDLIKPDTPNGTKLISTMIEVSTEVAVRCIKKYHEELNSNSPQSEK